MAVTAKPWVILAMLVLSVTPLLPAQQRSIWKGISPTAGARDIGILFSTNDILFDIEGYQQGVGAKISMDKWMFRGMVDILLNTGINPFSLNLGGVLERHFLPGPLSVYWGPSLETGLTISTNKTDADNWTQNIAWPLLTVGGVFGIELFLFEFLSVFLEYQAALALGLNINRISTAGSVSSTTEFTYKFDVGLGNSGMFGIVFYLMRRE
ncbi:hypothetical protein ES708_10356 [subsurface metagenome]